MKRVLVILATAAFTALALAVPAGAAATTPAPPTNIQVTAQAQTTITIAWSGPTTLYAIWLDGSYVTRVSAFAYTYQGLACGTSHRLGVRSVDAQGQVSSIVYISGSTAACQTGGDDPVVTAAGDICGTPTDCAATAALVRAINPARALTLGDNEQNQGTLAQFQANYAPNWGVFLANTSPAPGNHEYLTTGAAGYFTYFGARAPAAYYSFDIGTWHLVSLDSEIAAGPGSAQETWFKADLAAHPSHCTLVYWHKPRWSSGHFGPITQMDQLWRDAYAAGVEIVLSGHDHIYERFAPQSGTGALDAATGIRQFVVGTGGWAHGPYSTIQSNSQVRNNTNYGVLKLTLHQQSYDWQFVPVAGATFTDSGSATCH